jgi:phosphoglycolate phosphatase-like HAD superfamily hydrolase
MILDFDQCTATTERAHFDRFLSAVNSFMQQALTPTEFRAKFGRAFHKPEEETCRIISAVLTEECGVAACPSTGAQVQAGLIKQRAIDHLGLVLPPLVARQIVRADPAIASLLEVADRDGKHLGIATASGAAVVETFLAHLGLSGQFKVKVYADASWVAVPEGERGMQAPPVLTKPFPEHYLCAARLLGQHPADLVAFEDSGSGGCAALMAGIPLVLRPTNNVGKQLGKLEETAARVLRSTSIPPETRTLWGEFLLSTPLNVVRSFDQVVL